MSADLARIWTTYDVCRRLVLADIDWQIIKHKKGALPVIVTIGDPVRRLEIAGLMPLPANYQYDDRDGYRRWEYMGVNLVWQLDSEN